MNENTPDGLTSPASNDRHQAGSASRRCRQVLAVVLAPAMCSMAVVACASDDATAPGGSSTVPDRAGRHDDDTSSTASSVPGGRQLVDPDELRPVLTMTVIPGDHLRWMAGVPDVAVYGDGRVVVWDVWYGLESRAIPVRVRTGTIDSGFINLIETAERAGLTGGGLERLEPPPQEAGEEHGGGWLFGGRTADGVWTSRVVSGLGGYAPDVLPDPLADLAELRDALVAEASRATDEVDTSIWVVVGLSGTPVEGAEQSLVDDAPTTIALLPDLDSADVVWSRFGAEAGKDPWGRSLVGAMCTVIAEPAWATAPGSLNLLPYVLDERLYQLVLRPLMPHENDCVDVAQTATELSLT